MVCSLLMWLAVGHSEYLFGGIEILKPHQLLGPVARALCWTQGGVVIGGAAQYFYDVTVLSDDTSNLKGIDIVIPLDNWVTALKLIPISAVANSFGRFKFKDGAYEVDVWPDDVFRVALESSSDVKIWSPKHNKIFVRRG